MTHSFLLRTFCLLLLLSLAAGARAELRLQIDARGLNEDQRLATRQLLDEAVAALPPRLIERLDRRVSVRWAELPATVHGRMAGDRLLLDRALLAGLVDGSARRQQTGRTHDTQHRELLATVLHELAHLYDRAQLWLPLDRPQLARCARLSDSLGPVGLPDNWRGQTARSRS